MCIQQDLHTQAVLSLITHNQEKKTLVWINHKRVDLVISFSCKSLVGKDVSQPLGAVLAEQQSLYMFTAQPN